MSKVMRDREREQLEKEIEGKEYQELLDKLAKEHTFFATFSTWMDVVAFLRESESSGEKDSLLRVMFENHVIDNDPRWRTLLLVAFWPGLKALCNREKSWGVSYPERWSNTVFSFISTICKLDPARRRHRFTQKIMNDTIHVLRIEREEALKLAAKEVSTDNDELDLFVDENNDEVFTAVGDLRELMENGELSKNEFHLIVDTQVHDKPLHQVASELGISYQNAKKARQRAMKRLRFR